MTHKEFLCTMYDSELVEHAIEESKDSYKEHEAELLYKRTKIADMLPDRTGGSEIYDEIQRQMVYSYLHGADYVVRNELESVAPSKETFSEFHKNVDFAVLFDFGDNDFSLAMEAAAKTYCDEFNGTLHHIDMYDDVDSMRKSYLKQFEEICKIENIKEIMRCGFLAERMQSCAKTFCGRMPDSVAALESIKYDLNYIPWDKYKGRWEEIGGEFVETEKFPRFITGTNAEIAEDLKKYGHPDENTDREFPVWCNSEVVILYMKDGYLTYLTR